MTAVWGTPAHAEARALVHRGCIRMQEQGALPSVNAELVAHVQAVGWLETHYGSAWKEPGVGSANWGAIQHRCPPCQGTRIVGQPWDGQECFSYVDSTPQGDGSSKRYSVCFRRYGTMEDGVRALIDQVVVRRPSALKAALAGETAEFSTALYASRYYQGWGATAEERIRHHYDAVVGSMKLANAGSPLTAAEELELQSAIERVGRAFLQPLYLLDLARDDMRIERDRAYLEDG